MQIDCILQQISFQRFVSQYKLGAEEFHFNIILKYIPVVCRKSLNVTGWLVECKKWVCLKSVLCTSRIDSHSHSHSRIRLFCIHIIHQWKYTGKYFPGVLYIKSKKEIVITWHDVMNVLFIVKHFEWFYLQDIMWIWFLMNELH